jgi:hypothetical protein
MLKKIGLGILMIMVTGYWFLGQSTGRLPRQVTKTQVAHSVGGVGRQACGMNHSRSGRLHCRMKGVDWV